MYDAPPKGETRSPKHTHYVSLGNNVIYPAMRNLPGYEDDNPAEWRVASADEIERFKKGENKGRTAASGEVQLHAAPVAQAAPSSIKLADEEPAPPAPPAAADPADPPQLPPGALGAIGPAPAFKVD